LQQDVMLSLLFFDVVVFCCCAHVWMLFYIKFIHTKVYTRRVSYWCLRRRETRLRQRIRAMHAPYKWANYSCTCTCTLRYKNEKKLLCFYTDLECP